jgi:lysophospholipase L1-like esterase
VVTILCYGDSNSWDVDPATQGRLELRARWPGVLRASLGPGFEVIEEGVRGRTTDWDDLFDEGRDGLAYLVPCLKSHAPLDLVILMLGTNDLKAVFRLGPGEIAAGVATRERTVQRSAMGPDGTGPAILVPAADRPGNRRRGRVGPPGSAAERSRALAPLYRLVADSAGYGFLDGGEYGSAAPTDQVHIDATAHGRLGSAVAA